MNHDQTKQQIIDAFQFRHATKSFDPAQKITAEDFSFILETARLSPSSFGYEPWNLLVIQNEAIRNEIQNVTWGAQGQLPTASHYVVFLARTGRQMQPDGAHVTHMMDVLGLSDEAKAGRTKRYGLFLKEDFKIGDHEKAMEDWSAKQAYIALGNMMSAAAQIGIDSCPIEGFDQQAVEQLLARHDLLDRSVFTVPVMVAFGYRADEPKRAKQRRCLDEIVTFVD
ncbi:MULTISPECIES: NAD(P)H-dependent oxidoreductase [Exiguobacterium]|uniref:NAD(P)H-dependent oxidoreductase n=1 Tax=Exiguobacterium antarcticum TaxID=132920 RepID=A0ABT6R528_9BACL|nr:MULTISPECIES: NAD(P)H-dependent oxidoreductase [Exiguobacterium]AFS69397.1 Nitroreductase [Exiguobacterium antarcticum B7]MCT4781529.1 NAD(P)H-dependent oxidoreductase [Exiguobacterium soli]MDI3236059.1 NAD(P)H-dependent oxidoreductase [Exiguobacterium antarcticum]